MAYIAEKNTTLKDGHECLLRSALPGDAKAVRDFTIEAAKTSAHLILLPEEITDTHWRMRDKLKRYLNAPDELALLAMDGPLLVGQLLATKSQRQRLQHALDFGIAVKEGWRGRGLGRAMIMAMLGWAKSVPEIERIELHVHSDNTSAIHLYESLGFEHEGRRRKAIKYGDNKYMDDLIMGMLLTPAPKTSARLDIRRL